MESAPQPPRPEQEGFGEAGLGEAQSETPPADPEMIEEDPGTVPETGGDFEAGEGGVEEVGGDQDAEAPTSGDEVEVDEERDLAEGA